MEAHPIVSSKTGGFSDGGGANQLAGRTVIIRWDGADDLIWMSIGYNPFFIQYFIYLEMVRLCGYI